MAKIQFGSTITLKEFAQAVVTVGKDVTIIGQGEPGIGKSAMLKEICRQLPESVPAYIDCTLLDLGDFAMPEVVEERGVRVTRFAPNNRFKLQESKPVVVMLDEIGKAVKSVKNVLLTLMYEHRIGDVYLPAGSRVFGTMNLGSDGVGDSLEAHARNRATVVHIRKPHAGFNPDGSIDDDSWGMWAINNDIAPEVTAWVRQTPQCLESYTDISQRDNPYILNPVRSQVSCVTPRSLEAASDIIKKRQVMGDGLTLSLLAGTIGESAARDMQAFLSVVDKLPTREAILHDPAGAKMPKDVIAKCILVFGAISWVTPESLDKWMVYLKRMDMEWQAIFARGLMQSAKQKVGVDNKTFIEWLTSNQWVF